MSRSQSLEPLNGTQYGKRDLDDVIQWKTLGWRDDPGLPRRALIESQGSLSGRQRGVVATEEEKAIAGASGDQQMCFAGGCRSHEPRKAGGHWKLGKERKRLLLQSPRGGGLALSTSWL